MATRQGSETRGRGALSPAAVLEQELKEKGFADVMVTLTAAARAVPARAQARAAAAGVGADATVSAAAGFGSFGRATTGLPADLLSCFESAYEESIEEGMTSLSLRASAATAAASGSPSYDIAPVLHLENLGIVVGSVSTTGLSGLRRHAMVRDVRPIPELQLVRPRRMALAQPAPEITWGINQLNIPSLWAQGLEGDNVTVGHLDTGVDGTHPLLEGAFAAFAEFNYIGRPVVPDPPPHDTGVHGTHTAGTIVGRPVNGQRMGVAPKAKLASAIVIEGGRVTLRILSGLDWILRQGARVLSMSLGIPGVADDFLEITKILQDNGVLPCVAVGNEGPGTSRYPGNYTTVLSVGAMDQDGGVADFSSSQPLPPPPDRIVPDLVGPGVGVISAAPGNRYMSMDGTSMATPHLAGLAALLFQAKPDATPDQVRQAIFASCRRTANMAPDRANRGVPDAAEALRNL